MTPKAIKSSKAPRTYTSKKTGKVYPLFEAPYPMPVTVYKTDRRRAIVGDPYQCLISLGLLRIKGVEEAYVGAGNDAYVCFTETKMRAAYALHFTVNTQSSRVRDYFDTHKGVDTQALQLDPPTAGRTLNARAKANKRRREEVKNGAEVKHRERPYRQREVRLGVARRPRALIERNKVIGTPPSPAKPAPEPAETVTTH